MRIRFSYLAAAALLASLCTVAAHAQVVQATGKVTLQQADGTAVPIQNATVMIYRTDIKGQYKTTTGKNGSYVYAGIPFNGTYTIIVSAPNAKPTFLQGLRLSQQGNNDFTLDPGDGSTLTMDQLQAAAAAAPATGSAGNSSGGGSNNAASRRAGEEAAKQAAAVDEANKKVAADNTKLNEALKAGNDAFTAKKYDEAVAAYEQGIQLDATQAVFHRNKAMALRARGVDKYNAAVTAKDATGREAAKADIRASAEAAEKALAMQRQDTSKSGAAAAGGTGAAAPAAPAAGAASAGQNPDLPYLDVRQESYRLALLTNIAELADPAAKAIQEYVAAEPDPIKKAKSQASLGSALFQSGKIDEAIATYQQILTATPDNLDAMYGMALAYASSPDAAKQSQAGELFKKFAAKAPDADPRKQEAAQIAESLGKQQSAPKTDADAGAGGRNRKRKS